MAGALRVSGPHQGRGHTAVIPNCWESLQGDPVEERLHLLGWVLFLICAPLFLVSALRGGDMWGASASIVFGVGVVLFLIALRTKQRG